MQSCRFDERVDGEIDALPRGSRPMLSIAASFDQVPNSICLQAGLSTGGIPLLADSAPGDIFVDDSRTLPLRPIWRGFAINTIFYAALLWPLLSGPFALRRLNRRKRGLCVACGYDLRHADHAACPECRAVSGPAAGAIG